MFSFKDPAVKTVDDVLSAFRNTIADLQEVAATNTEQAAAHDRAAAEALSKKAAAEAEASRAASIAAQMQAVFG